MAQIVNGKKLIERSRRWRIADESFRHEKVAFSHMPQAQQQRALKSYQRRMLDAVQLAELRTIASERIWL
jgi:hypothetical protein